MSVVKRRCHGLDGIAQIAGAVGCAHSQIFCGCRKRACCSSVDSRLVSLPEPPASFPDRPEIIERAAIRIRSERKWPEKVVLDTSHPTMTPPVAMEPPAAHSVRLPSDEAPGQSNREALAQLKPDTPSAAVDHQTMRIKRGLAARSKRVA